MSLEALSRTTIPPPEPDAEILWIMDVPFELSRTRQLVDDEIVEFNEHVEFGTSKLGDGSEYFTPGPYFRRGPRFYVVPTPFSGNLQSGADYPAEGIMSDQAERAAHALPAETGACQIERRFRRAAASLLAMAGLLLICGVTGSRLWYLGRIVFGVSGQEILIVSVALIGLGVEFVFGFIWLRSRINRTIATLHGKGTKSNND